MNDIATWSVSDGIAVLTVDNPPVNAIGQSVREALVGAVRRLEETEAANALIIICAGKTFFSGADIKEFGKPPTRPFLTEVVDTIDACSKPIIAAIHGNALGGGLEVAMACHRRVALRGARLGLPEVNLGLMPGARGTQMLPRLAGTAKALDMIVFGKPISAADALEAGLVDTVTGDDLLVAAFAEARAALGMPIRRTSDLTAMPGDDDAITAFAGANARKIRGLDAPAAILQSIGNAIRLPFAEGAAKERELFLHLREGPQSAALRHVFFAEREAAKVPELDGIAPRAVERIGIVGSGTMGSGIATAMLVAGLPVTLFERDEAALERGAAAIARTIDGNVRAGRMGQEAGDAAKAALAPSLTMDALGGADLIVEAAYETMEVKRAIFGQLNDIAKPGAILASNTSYLDIDDIAAATDRPGDVLGLHFFSPAHIMRLLEVVRGAQTAPDALATAFALGKRLRKVPVLSGNAWGFIGNRMLAVRREQAEKMAVEGASPAQIDAVAEGFGFAMGPFRVGDLAGLDLGWSAQGSTGATIRERLNEAGRHGQKAGKGFYDYGEDRQPAPSAEADAIIARFAADNGIAQRSFSDAEILDRLLWPMVDEGAQILAEGIARRESDVDAVWLNGYGWPRHTGGPMYHARRTGFAEVAKRLEAMDYPVSDSLRRMAKESVGEG